MLLALIILYQTSSVQVVLRIRPYSQEVLRFPLMVSISTVSKKHRVNKIRTLLRIVTKSLPNACIAAPEHEVVTAGLWAPV